MPLLGLNGSLHHRKLKASSPPAILVQPAVVQTPSPPRNRAALPQHNAALTSLPAATVKQQPPPAMFSTTTAAPATSLPKLFIGNVPLLPHSTFKVDDDKIARGISQFIAKNPQFYPTFGAKRGEVGTGHGVKKTETHRSPGVDKTSTLADRTLDDRRFEHGVRSSQKHVVIMMPNELGGESACKVDVEYEWLPPKCTGCSSLGHSTKECPISKPTKPAIAIYVRKPLPPTPTAQEVKLSEQGQTDLVSEETHPETETDIVGEEISDYGKNKSNDIVLFNAFDVLRENDDDADASPRGGTTKLRSEILSANSGNRIWIAWNDELIDVEFLNVGSQFVHCRVLIHELHETILITVVYGANEVSARRELWQGLIELAATVGNVPWLVGGDFNAVLDMSEVSGASGDIRVAINEFNDCILQTGLLSLPMQGERFTWHNCSLDGRSLWKRLDRLIVNDVWMDRWPNLFYTCLTPRTSDHSPLVFKGDCRNMQVSLFRFDNYLALSPGFLASIHSIWHHPVNGTLMYSVTRKLKALKSVFRQQRRSKGIWR
ncbi:hypothetical protein Sango_2988800 [Sesamum angolense]|uniref:Uncharacterized protein n=1 Tax=Sesamum angolense TaxID=2727404 RepID=A0AAE1T3B0_9LAMI|nr:hypothetical protein Sango_2988800 [Sesamum angolense]